MIETEERLQLVADVVKADLDERFAGKVAFDPIVVAPGRSWDGDNYFRIFVVVPDGTFLGGSQMNWALTNIRDNLWAMGIQEFPSISYVDLSDWLDPEYYDGGKRGVYLERF